MVIDEGDSGPKLLGSNICSVIFYLCDLEQVTYTFFAGVY